MGQVRSSGCVGELASCICWLGCGTRAAAADALRAAGWWRRATATTQSHTQRSRACAPWCMPSACRWGRPAPGWWPDSAPGRNAPWSSSWRGCANNGGVKRGGGVGWWMGGGGGAGENNGSSVSWLGPHGFRPRRRRRRARRRPRPAWLALIGGRGDRFGRAGQERGDRAVSGATACC
jgi:hypothetical protein